jgi:Stress responsive A/B Barrel Domain
MQKLLRHVVIFKYKESSTAAELRNVTTTFQDLKRQIPEIKAFEWGINNSPENHDQGFTHCYILSFESENDRDNVYQKHPAHLAFQDVLMPHLEKVFVLDYWVE